MPKATIKRAKDRTPQERCSTVYPPKWDRKKVMDYVCGEIEKGYSTMAVILADLTPEQLESFAMDGSKPTRFIRENLDRWRREDPEMQQRMDEAFIIGHDRIALRTRKTARGKKAAEGGDSTGNVERDKVIIATDLKLLEYWSIHYRRRLMHSNDPDNPLPAPVFLIQPVMPAPVLTLEHEVIDATVDE